MRRTMLAAIVLGTLTAAAAAADGGGAEEEFVVSVQRAPAHGVVVGQFAMPSGSPATQPAAARRLEVVATTADGKAVPVQIVPPLEEEAREWLLVLKLPGGGDQKVTMKLVPRPAPATAPATAPAGPATRPARFVAAGAQASLEFVTKKGGGLPSAIRFGKGGKLFDRFTWNDRAHDSKLGGYRLDGDPNGSFEVLADGPICSVVRTRGRYLKGGPTEAVSNPHATYDWLIFRELPLVFVRSAMQENGLHEWAELHFLELNWPGEDFPRWAGGEPQAAGKFEGTKKSHQFSQWAVVHDGRAGIGMLRCGGPLLYDGHGEYGTYLHAHGSRAWAGWSDVTADFTAWLWVGESDDPPTEVSKAEATAPTDATVTVVDAAQARKFAQIRRELGDQRDPSRRREMAIDLLEKERDERLTRRDSGYLGTESSRLWTPRDLALVYKTRPDGLRDVGFLDLIGCRDLSVPLPPPLFVVTMRETATGRLVQLPSDSGWGKVGGSDPESDPLATTIHFAKPSLPSRGTALADLEVFVRVETQFDRSEFRWSIEVKNPSKEWGVWRVVFPQVAMGNFAPDVRVLVPQGAGVVHQDPFKKPFRYSGTYPSGWAAMQFAAAYDANGSGGLYFGMHDPNASTKDLRVESYDERRGLVIAFDHPVPDMGKPGVDFRLSGQAVVQAFRGDWFDAAMIYRDWVRENAKWWPKLTPGQGRADTPAWMRYLCVWAMLSGEGKGAVPAAKEFVEAMGMPAGFHWYNWHRIPFDNDYPHYFPPKDGFAQAVAEIQGKLAHPAYVMPYINGRLWDTRDRDANDFEFTRLALPAATKDISGKPYIESYGSKERDGSDVKLAAMCPSTALWQGRVREIVGRLTGEYGTKAVYIDQVAAAAPVLCFDASHGHLLGGGAWWVDSYAKLMAGVRQGLPADRMLTTECNAEPYVKWFDGYLTWHWQYDGQVPAFPAVYGGAIQMFGRAYRGGPTKDLALRMKAGQQLVFGEQIGWMDAGVAKEKENAAFIRQVAQLRHRLVRFFYAGQMARPPRLGGAVPTVTADWQWSGVWPVTTDAVLTGAWEIPAERRLAMIFVNVSDTPVEADVSFDAAASGLGKGPVRLTTVTAGIEEPAAETAAAKFTRHVRFEPGKAWAWVMQAKEADKAK